MDILGWGVSVEGQDIVGEASRLYSSKQNYTTYYLNPKHLNIRTSQPAPAETKLLIRSKTTKSRKREFVIYTSSDLRVDVSGREVSWAEQWT